MVRIHCIVITFLLVMAAACSGTNTNDVSEDNTEQTEATATNTGSAQQASQPRAAEPSFATLGAGTVVAVRLLDRLDTSVNQSGDTFRAVVDQDILEGNKVIVPRGSQVEGKLTFVQRAGRVQGRAAMSMQFTALTVGGQTYPILSEILSFEAEATKTEDAAKVGIGSGIGAVVGAIAGGGKGAAIGAAVGAGAGGATVAATRGKELKYEAEQPFEFTLSENVRIKLE